MTIEKNSLKDWAMEYATNGIHIFPLAPREKIPLKGTNGLKDASCDLNKVENWWDQYPDANIGIPMGKINNLCGLDIDPKDGADPNFISSLPKTYTTSTPMKGFHAFFKYVDGIKNGKKIDVGVTLRGEGYYFVLPPSIHPQALTSYKPLSNFPLFKSDIADCPQWIIDHEGIKLKEFKKENGKIGEGQRHEAMKALVVALFANKKDENEILKKINRFNESQFLEPLPWNEVQALIVWARNKVEKNKGIEINKPYFVDDSEEPEKIFPVEALTPILSIPAKIIAEKVSAPIEMICSSFLAATALCVQEFYNIKAFGGIRPVSLNFITIADSGERKSTVDKLVLSEHYKWRKEKEEIYLKEKTRYLNELEEWKDSKGKGKSPKPSMPKAPILFVSEPTMEGLFFCLKYHRNSVGLFSDEGGSFLGGYSMKQENGKNTIAKLNQLWDGSPIDRIRKGNAEGEIDVLYNKRVSSHLMMQSKIAEELYSNEYAKSQGFLARCLVCHPKSKVGKRAFLYTIELPSEMEEYKKQVRFFLNKQKTQEASILSPTPEALKVIEDFFYEIEPLQNSGKELSLIRDFASKIIEHCIRIAAVLEVFNNPTTTEISENTMKGAIEIGRFYLFSQVKTTERSRAFPSKDCETLFNKLLKREVWEFRELQQHCPRRFSKKKDLEVLLHQLAELGFCRYDIDKKLVTT